MPVLFVQEPGRERQEVEEGLRDNVQGMRARVAYENDPHVDEGKADVETIWANAFRNLSEYGATKGRTLVERPGQTTLAKSILKVVTQGGQLLGEAPVGTGKSVAYLVPLVHAALVSKERSVISTETVALQDQLVDKDLPTVTAALGSVTFCALKGRSWYLCMNRAGVGNPITMEIGGKGLGNGERRDVERVLGRKLDQETWDSIAGEAEFCSQNRCQPDRCYSSKMRSHALDCSVVVTNHALLRTDADMDDGLLGDFKHLVIDEAHTLEKSLVDGWSDELSPYDMRKSLDAVLDALDRTNLKYDWGGRAEEAERLLMEGMDSTRRIFEILAKRKNNDELDDMMWRRETFPLSQQFVSGAPTSELVSALNDYEVVTPGRMLAASNMFDEMRKALEDKLKGMDKGTRKVLKGRNAAKRLSSVLDMMSESIETREGIVRRYGVPYVVVGSGQKAWKGAREVRVRCIPLDVSQRTRETIWDGLKSVTLVSGTLRDETDGTFRYIQSSLGLSDAHTLVVGSTFNFSENQLVYVTPAQEDPVDVPGAKFGMQEIVNLIEASKGRALLLFTANAEMEYVADRLRTLHHHGQFQHRLLVQERGVNKQDLVAQFSSDTNSVLLGSKSFFTGVDFPGETCSIVIIAKFPRPQWNALCRAQTAYWRTRGFPNWYARESLQVFKQANGRLIRNETDRGVIAILDQRAANPKDDISKLVGLEVSSTGSSTTNSLSEMEQWLNGTH